MTRTAINAAFLAVTSAAVCITGIAGTGCAGSRTRGDGEDVTTITFSGSALGAEGQVLARQVDRFMSLNPAIHVRIQRTPDDATQRHQLYVQWLNARVGTPDVLQLDVIWTPEFAAAGWILPLTRWAPDVSDFFPASVEANRWAGTLYAIPWWMDVGMLYWRTDLLRRAPATMDELVADLRAARAAPNAPPSGLVWQGARYEGLVTVFVEFLGAFGGRIMDDQGRIVVDDPHGVRALTLMRDLVRGGLVPRDALTWHEEEARLAFENGGAVMMRNWPYAYTLMNDHEASRVAGRFAVAPMPAAPGGSPSATLGGQQLAINAASPHPDAAYRLIAYLTAPRQAIERVRIAGNFPPRRSLYADSVLRAALPIPADQVQEILEHATLRPVTPIYSQLSELLQIQLHRTLTGQAEPEPALREAARQMTGVVERTRVRELIAEQAGRR